MDKQPTCQRCGAAFEPRTSGGKPQKFCSRTCYDKWHSARHREARRPERPPNCAECGSAITHNLSAGHPRRYCSEKCKQRVGNRAQRRRKLPAPKQPDRSCEVCGTTFKPTRRDQVYCSSRMPPYCAVMAYRARKSAGEPPRQGVDFQRQCVECGRGFVAQKVNAKWCSAICRIRTSRRDESRRRRPGTGAGLYADREIFERDKWICQLCGQPVDKNATRRDPLGATIDHVLPLVAGGTDDRDNVVTAHWRCNREKGSRLIAVMPLP